MPLVAHTSEDGRIQPFSEHARAVANLAARYAAVFGAENAACTLGLLHDAGKCSPAGQARLLDHAPKVEHAAAGAEVLGGDPTHQQFSYLLSYCVAGHHTGLPDGGVPTDAIDCATLCAKLKRQRQRARDYAAYEAELGGPVPPIQPFLLAGSPKNRGFSYSFRTRMLFSCLVDADFLDTESFMQNAPLRSGMGESLDVLFERLKTHLSKFGEPVGLVGEKRRAVLEDCLHSAAQPRGLFSLTVPTGGGKTLSSLAFALSHALKNGLDRVIYVIPYTSIIDQTAAVFRGALGAENVLEHHHNVVYDTPDDREMDLRVLAAENWDAPVVVTTNVQFFESLFSNRTSRCRKLHNIANSVLIFDEAQMLPLDLLLPCVHAIEELVLNHCCTAVLCSATQPALDPYFAPDLRPQEICSAPKELYEALRRVRFESLGMLDDPALLERLNAQRQVLCIVNTKAQAQTLYFGLVGEENYHLSTFMTPAHRRRTLEEIRARLDEKLPCRVVSTSLIEAGVDVDFPVVYRELAGLDSAVQAAGRCNREGNIPPGQAVVFLFEPEEQYRNKRPSSVKLPIEVASLVMRSHADIGAPETIRDYFTRYFNFCGASLDQKEIVRQFNKGLESGLSLPFAKVAEEFHVIDSPTRTVLIPNDDEALSLLPALKSGVRSREILRKVGLYSVMVYPRQYNLLFAAGALDVLDEELAVLRDETLYSQQVGLTIPGGGIGIFA